MSARCAALRRGAETARAVSVTALVALTVVSCDSATLRTGPQAAESLRLQITPVLLDQHDASLQRVGQFVYAGGIEIREASTDAVSELSDLRIISADRLVAVSDRGRFFEARLLFDRTGRLSGLADPRVVPLLDEDGSPLRAAKADAEGLDVLPDGARLVSFERDHRIWLYPADGSAPRPTPKPEATFPDNEGMEALTYYPAAGRNTYLVGGEGGTIWLCSLSATCMETAFGGLVPAGYGLAALAAYREDGAFAMLSRSYDARRGVRISVKLIGTVGAPTGRVLDEMKMAAPLTVDNFEGLAVVPRANGGIRLYLLSDDNGAAAQHTYLLAFDWQPAG